ncbi:MAG: DUF4331 family protein [Deltaproteobacteria bacterium]|nr:DUF4331 family protein [Deltaproteobacteria bacterium]
MKQIFFLMMVLIVSKSVFASDHIDGPVTMQHRVGDITDLYAFPSPQNPEHLTLILNTYPFVSEQGHFSDKINYDFIIHEADIVDGAFKLGLQVFLSCRFRTPHDHSQHQIICESDTGLYAEQYTNQIADQSDENDFQVYAGRRSDPFFFNADWAESVGNDGIIPTSTGDDTMALLNILSIVVEVDMAKLFKDSNHSMYAVAAEIITHDDSTDSSFRVLDRVGRPEITNVSMVANGRRDFRDQYNQESSFGIPDDKIELYRERLISNIAFYDGIDGNLDWTKSYRNKLADLLVHDYLVVDIAKPCESDAYFDIEISMLSGEDHESCGGRKITDDIMDTLFTLFINANNGDRISDDVDEPSELPLEQFPYLAPPSDGVMAKLKAYLARKKFSLD